MSCELVTTSIVYGQAEGLDVVEDRNPFQSDTAIKYDPSIFMRTVCSIGEASRKSSSCEVSNPPISIDNSRKVRLGKAKWVKGGQPNECNENSCRFMALSKRRGEESVVASGLSRSISSWRLILRVQRSGRGPEFNSENVRMSAQLL